MSCKSENEFVVFLRGKLSGWFFVFDADEIVIGEGD